MFNMNFVPIHVFNSIDNQLSKSLSQSYFVAIACVQSG